MWAIKTTLTIDYTFPDLDREVNAMIAVDCILVILMQNAFLELYRFRKTTSYDATAAIELS